MTQIYTQEKIYLIKPAFVVFETQFVIIIVDNFKAHIYLVRMRVPNV
jgi:hypothetical protein